MNNKFKKAIGGGIAFSMNLIWKVAPNFYMKYNPRFLRWRGINIADKVGFIAPSVEWDGTDNFSIISIGKDTTISKNVLFLTHDYSLNRGMQIKCIKGKYMFKGSVEIGENCFIGARVIFLPNTKIGDNCIVGSGAVVKGTYPSNSIIIGNPAKVVCTIDEWIDKHLQKEDYIRLY